MSELPVVDLDTQELIASEMTLIPSLDAQYNPVDAQCGIHRLMERLIARGKQWYLEDNQHKKYPQHTHSRFNARLFVNGARLIQRRLLLSLLVNFAHPHSKHRAICVYAEHPCQSTCKEEKSCRRAGRKGTPTKAAYNESDGSLIR